MSKNVRVTVPEMDVKEIRVSYDGDDATVYAITDGHVSVEPNRVARFLNVIDGSAVLSETKAAEVAANK